MISQESNPSEKLLSGDISIKYPTSLGDFDGKQASDGYFMHAVIDAKLMYDENEEWGRLNQVYVAFKKNDLRADEQL